MVSQCRVVGVACTSPTAPTRVRIVAVIGMARIIAFQRPQLARSTARANQGWDFNPRASGSVSAASMRSSSICS